LTILGALEVKNREFLDSLLELKIRRDPTEITNLGSLLSKLPLSPKYSKMLILSTKYQVLRYTIMIVACLSVAEVFKEIPVKEIVQNLDQQQYDEDLLTAFDRIK